MECKGWTHDLLVSIGQLSYIHLGSLSLLERQCHQAYHDLLVSIGQLSYIHLGSLSLLERQCHQAYFQEPQTKGWLFDSLVTPSLMYVSIVWALGLPSFMWTQLERPLVTMLSRQLRSKSTVPHDIIIAQFTLPSMLGEALFLLVVFIQRIHRQPQDRLSHQAFEESPSLYKFGDTSTSYSIVVSWRHANCLHISSLPPLRYNHIKL